jgi:EAL domain-containing protein (putative c-di-GMP-specific phosphodiesterase class I)
MSMAKGFQQAPLTNGFEHPRLSELRLYFQPQVSLDDGSVIGLEALIRWQHPQRGLLPPAAFLEALEGSALALPVGWWVLDTACAQLAAWRSAGVPDVRIAVNLFAAQMRADGLVARVTKALVDNLLPPALLQLEVTERTALHQDDESLAAVRQLRALGVSIAFDDFGTGYASLSSLRRFPLTTLKIDRSFVRDLLTSRRDMAITRATLSMGHELGLEVIAEGIETAAQEVALQALGCRAGQGFRYGQPMSADAAAELLLRGRGLLGSAALPAIQVAL